MLAATARNLPRTAVAVLLVPVAPSYRSLYRPLYGPLYGPL